MKFKKVLSAVLCCSTLVGGMAGAACGSGGNKVIVDGKTINVRLVNAGYGSAWFEKIAEKFEALYAEEGYKVNLLEPDNSFQGQTALNEMRLDYDLNQIDLYLTSGCYVYQVLDKTFGECVENLNDVYNQGAINFDGSVEATPIKDTEGAQMYKYLLVNPDKPDDYYRFQYFVAPQGLVCNQKVLKDYGFDYLPVTTDELFEMYDAIYYGANGKEGTSKTGVYPQTWAQANAYSYPYYNFLDQFGSMLGYEGWANFFSLDHLRNGDTIDNAGDYYATLEPELKAALEAFIHQYDTMYSYVGSTTQKHDMAHAQIVTGKAAFMADGGYFYNEVKTNFANFLPNMRIIKQPTASALGTILKLDGSGNNKEKCEEILAFCCRAVDDGADQATLKTLAEAQFPGVTFTDEQMRRIYEARTLYSVSLQADGYIAKGSIMKEQASLLLRMMASSDAAELMAEYCMPHAYNPVENIETDYEFVSDVNRMVARTKSFTFNNYKLGLRNETNLGVCGSMGLNLCTKIMADIGVVNDPNERNYATLAQGYYDDVKTYVNNNWATLLKNAGY